jgi:arylsulfatase A-like enzyme
LLSHAGGAHHWAQPPLGGQWRDRRNVNGLPCYDSVIPKDKATIGTILRDNGYATSWFGKNHNTPTYQYSLAGPFDQWPSGMGFEYFYGFMGGETNQWTPYLFRDHTQIYPSVGKPDYNLTTDMAMRRSVT